MWLSSAQNAATTDQIELAQIWSNVAKFGPKRTTSVPHSAGFDLIRSNFGRGWPSSDQLAACWTASVPMLKKVGVLPQNLRIRNERSLVNDVIQGVPEALLGLKRSWRQRTMPVNFEDAPSDRIFDSDASDT